MRIRMNDAREARFEELMMASPENAKSKAIDRAVEFYIEMVGSHAQGKIDELLETAKEENCVSGPTIAEILDTKYHPVHGEFVYKTGEEQ
jgi:hypothetical protein